MKCKICGAQTTIDTISGIAICNYCGTKQALPLFTTDSERLLYDSGNKYLLNGEYDKAENVFSQLLSIKPGAAELYWDLVLCKYGVTYVKDPQTGKYIPTCNRTHYTPIFSDSNYVKAIELSSGEKTVLFEEDAKIIDGIQKGIIAVSKKEKPFDVFISYKETDANGNRTKDSIQAQRLYEKLTEAGYKVFFSRITLEDKIGTEYEPYIYAALYSSKVMLTVCSSKGNIEATWVKNEWSRFLGFRQNDNSKTLLPLYFDMDETDLPKEFVHLSAYDMQADGFVDELLRGIKKIIPLPIMKAKRCKQILKATGIVAASLVVVAGVAAAIIIPKELEEKRIAAEEAVQASEAAAQEKAMEDAYQAAMTLFDNADYTAAEAAFIALGDYKDSDHMAARCPIQPDYDAAMQLYNDGKYAQATWAFQALGDYEDAPIQVENAKLSWRKSLAYTNATDNPNAANASGNLYYITDYGTVNDSDTDKTFINIGEHGKAVSIAHGWGDICVLYEDGTIHNKDGFQNVVQIVTVHQVLGIIALKADGTVVVENATESDYPAVEGFYADVANWKNIVKLYDYTDCFFADYRNVLVGIDTEGNIFSCMQMDYFSEEENSYAVKSFMECSEYFKDIKLIAGVSVDVEYGEGFFQTYYVNIAAERNDGKIVIYDKGEITIKESTDFYL